jgi:putative addiction module component (TIGR02574 family)
MIADQFPGLWDLPDDAKLQLAEELFRDVIGGSEGDDSELEALIDARLAEYQRHPERVSTWEAVKARLLNRNA